MASGVPNSTLDHNELKQEPPTANEVSVVDRYVKAQAPVNIAVIKYWGKSNEALKIPINDSLSATLNMLDMCTTTSVHLSADILEDQLMLNGAEVPLTESSPATQMIREVRSLCSNDSEQQYLLKFKARIISNNNFPTAAGLASSAAGYACLAYALGHAYGVTDLTLLSRIARNGSGSACRSLFGGFVHWAKGTGHDDSMAEQVVDHLHWPEMRVVICVVNDGQKDVSSSHGMSQSVKTSPLIKYRAENVVPRRIAEIRQAILDRDFATFADITMRDSNEFHAICLDTHPPIFYLNETSRRIIKICHLINDFYGKPMVAYTFDAGPNACIYLLEGFVSTLIEIIIYFFPQSDEKDAISGESSRVPVKGRPYSPIEFECADILKFIESKNVIRVPSSIKYIINTSIGDGPKVIEER